MRTLAAACLLVFSTSAVAGEPPIPGWPLAQDFQTVYRSPSPSDTFCYTPGVCRLDGGEHAGRIVVTMDVGGPGARRLAKSLAAPFAENWGTRGNFGQVFLTDDGGKSFRDQRQRLGVPQAVAVVNEAVVD